MDDSSIKIAVTPPAFCKSDLHRGELTRSFPNTTFNEKDRYLTEPELIEFLQDAQGAIIGRDPVNENVLKSLPKLKIIAKYGVGLDNIDQDAMSRHQVKFGWTAGVNSLSVAELTLGFMIGLCHNAFSGGFALKLRLLSPFKCRILVRDIVDKEPFCQKHGAIVANLNEVIEQSELLTLHVPLTDATSNLIDEPVLRRMKPTAFLINTSRGEVVDQSALKMSLMEGMIAGAALDVFAQEPPTDAEFLSLPNLMVTPHLGGNTLEAVESMGRSAIEHLNKFFL
jgi:D-3-phosphoglycerate dehydrogenase